MRSPVSNIELTFKTHECSGSVAKALTSHLRRKACRHVASEVQMSDYKGAFLLLPVLPKAKALLADRGYHADWFRAALMEEGITPRIPPNKNRKYRIEYNRELYKSHHKIENMFGRIKDWRCIAMRYDRCAHTFFRLSVSPPASSFISINES